MVRRRRLDAPYGAKSVATVPFAWRQPVEENKPLPRSVTVLCIGLMLFPLGLALLAVAYIIFLMLLLSTPSVQAELDAAQSLVEPLIPALEKYRQRHSSYPESLESLVRQGLIPSIPVIPGTSKAYLTYQPAYWRTPDGTAYFLQFGYMIKGGLAFPPEPQRQYCSWDGRWEQLPCDPLNPVSMLEGRAGREYKRNGSKRALETAVRSYLGGLPSIEGKPPCCWADDLRMRILLGEGQPLQLPANAPETAVFYPAKDCPGFGYAFVFAGPIGEARTRPGKAVSMLSEDGRWHRVAECK
jgi:hypothetical protein